mgnify:CR=1 FL=1
MYKILKKDNDLALMIEQHPMDPDGPMFIYDGSDTALFFRDWGCHMRLKGLSEPTGSLLKAATEITVFEVLGGEVVRRYTAPVRIVRDVKSLMA